MLALSLETAKTAAVVAIVVILGTGVLSAWLMKTIVSKVVTLVVLAGLAFAVYSQRTNLQDCADRAKAEAADFDVEDGFTCSFFGTDVDIDLGD